MCHTTRLGWILPCLLIFAGCSTVQPAAVRVQTVTLNQYVPVPQPLLAPCPRIDTQAIQTNADLLQAFLAAQARLQTCDGQLKAIGSLPPP